MELSIKRIVYIIACMHGRNIEAVAEINDSDEYECYLFLGQGRNIPVSYEELRCLEDNDIIELDSGTAEGIDGEKGRNVYCLTNIAQERIITILNNKKILRLNV